MQCIMGKGIVLATKPHATMAESNKEIFDLDHFKCWKVNNLKRNGNRQKRKEELAALAYAASIQNLSLFMTKEDERDGVKKDYHSLLVVGDKKISDPLKASDGWLDDV
ncbi:hypothetical protein CHARACLAT_030928 [Characodon lateralis]|uniref:Uncharacterized protein n=1 Tax=Characodon lateralis TaxID=208331 RepID=A0ABU7F7F3_9TELE|nr:hypothetical protein [Characodon lateralis]